MFSKVAILMTATMAALVVAGDIKNSCNTGPVQCCNSLYKSGSEGYNKVHGIVGAAVGSITGQAGLECSPITAIGVGSGAECSTQPVCCTHNDFKALVALGCSPVNVNV